MSIGQRDSIPASPRDGASAARRIARGVRRMLASAGHSTVEEMSLPDGRRADIVALQPDGFIAIVEIKSCRADFRSDRKWRNYLEFCDQFYFAIDAQTPMGLIPADVGLILADDFGAQLVRPAPEARLAAARRKSMLLRFARLSADRLHALQDPRWRDPTA
ncbi:MAG: MmcB family DNA repair protein [Hyphomicrobiales bacterium]|nr:MmcB family DNA repair protein [Hyphomicrobiales bacterium]